MKRIGLIGLALVLIATIVAPAAAEQVRILRDEYGVPHVYGSTLEATWYGVGYAVGQDRLWQADLLRRLGTGTSAEFFGPASVDGDVVARSLYGPRERRDALFQAAARETQVILESFAAGMNAWITEATASGQLPIEYEALGLTPRPWLPDDSIAVSMALLANFGEFGADELTNAADLQELIARFGPAEGSAVFNDTHWLDDPSAPTSVPSDGMMIAARSARAPRPARVPAVPAAAPAVERAMESWRSNLRRAGLDRGPASNAIVLGPQMTADGYPLLLHGPQMGYTVPQINHEMGIHGGGFDVTGMEIAGLPAVVIGITSRHAWTLTSGISDNSDIYVEVLNPANPGQYLFQGAWLYFDCRKETIVVRGGPDDVREICESVHGPVLGTAPGRAFTLKIATRGLEVQSYEALLAATRARSVGDLDQALSRAAYNFNFLYADFKGNIAYWHVGKIPIRAAGDNPWLPHDGTGSAEWQGFLPWKEMPHAINPDRGWMTSWNNKPEAGWRNSTRGFGTFGPVHRVNTLLRLLEQVDPGTATPATIEQINLMAGWTTDTPSGSAGTVFVSSLLGELLTRVDDGADPRLPAIVELLGHWDWLQVDRDLDGHYDNPAVPVFNTWWQALSDRIFADDLGGTLQRNVVGNLMARLLDDDPALPLLHDYLGGETVEDAVTGALIDTLDDLEALYGSFDPADWLQPVAMIQWEPLGVGTVPNTIWMNRGTYNQITHMGPGRWRFAHNVISPGQSGDPFSPHFADQLELYATWTYKPMRLTRKDLVGNTESEVKLLP
jgi:penicillin amidase